MKMLHHFALPLLLLLLYSCLAPAESDLIERLDDVLSDKSVYDNHFAERTQVLKDVLSEQHDLEHIYNLQMRLADCYRANCLDSVILYLAKARETASELNEPAKIAKADFQMSIAYVKAGYEIDSNDILDKYRGKQISPDNLEDYYKAEVAYWGETMAYASDRASSDEKLVRRDEYIGLLLEILPQGTWYWYNLKREKANEISDVEMTRYYAGKMLEVSAENSREWAEAAYYYAHSFSETDPQSFKSWIIRSAIADIMCATKDYASLNEVARFIFNSGDIERAFRYSADHCMVDALYFNGKLRPWQISKFFPEIESAYNLKNARTIRVILGLLSGTLALFLLSLFLSFFLSKRQKILNSMRTKLEESYMEIDRRNRELEAINHSLVGLNAKIHEADKVKQEYITQFLSILSENITSKRQYRNWVLKCIRQGKTKILTDEINELPPIENDILDFYKMFDQTFVNIYPDFVRKFNDLLVEGAAIVPKGQDILTPELRIFALIKLGISDSSRIASLLHYSANTIYNYRAKIKNKAKGSRDAFEEAVRNID